MTELTQELLTSEFSYAPDSGQFSRLHKRGNRRAGSVAGSVKSNGYVYISTGESSYLAHRLAWLYTTGSWPANDIDHINGDRTDNRSCNLREATRGENMQNERRARSSNHSSGLLGVSWSKAAKKWAAGIKLNGIKRHLGLFDDPTEAHHAYLDAKREMHPFGMI